MDPIELTRELCAVYSPSGEEAAVVDLVAGRLAEAGWTVTRQPVSPGRHNVFAVLDPPVVVFSTHLDVVPPELPLSEDDEWLYGRGVCDAKGVAATMIAAAERLRARGERRIALLFTVGEEVGSDGAKAADALEPRGRYLINGEPTENRLSVGQKGALLIRLEARGKAAHSAYPEQGHSAVDALLDTIERIRKVDLPPDPLLGPWTLNIGTISGGVAVNVIPPAAEAQLFFRTVGDTAPLHRAVAGCLAPGVTAISVFETPSVRAPAPDGWETTVVSFASDLPHLPSFGVGYQMGPGTILVAHTANERIRKAEIRDGVDQYVKLAQQLLAQEAAR